MPPALDARDGRPVLPSSAHPWLRIV